MATGQAGRKASQRAVNRTIRIPPAVWVRLGKAATLARRSRSNLVLVAIERLLDEIDRSDANDARMIA